jgi:hypothetical protein
MAGIATARGETSMKPIPSIILATWMLEHLTLGSPNESLSGDLLEEFRSGRSAGWYWRQTLSTIAITLSGKSRAYVLPVVFSAGWSIAYPALLLSITRSRLTQTILERMAAHDWPYSTGLHFVGATTPAAMFVWIGFFLYLVSCNQVGRQLSMLRLLGSLSISLNVLFVATIGQHLRNSDIDVRNVSGKNFNSHFVALSIPLALSLFSALVCALPPVRRRQRNADSLAA